MDRSPSPSSPETIRCPYDGNRRLFMGNGRLHWLQRLQGSVARMTVCTIMGTRKVWREEERLTG